MQNFCWWPSTFGVVWGMKSGLLRFLNLKYFSNLILSLKKIIFLILPDFLLKQIRLGSRRWKCAKEKTRRKGQNLHHHDHHIVISTNFFREYQSEMREDKKIKFTWVESQSIKSAPAQPEKATMAIVQRWKRGEKQYARSEKLAEETSGPIQESSSLQESPRTRGSFSKRGAVPKCQLACTHIKPRLMAIKRWWMIIK